MLIPVGLDETRLNRWPWISIAILASCVLAFLATSFSGGEKAARSRFEEVAAYWGAHPYLELPQEMDRHFGLTREKLLALAGRTASKPRPPSEPFLSVEQRQLDDLCAALVEAYESMPERRFSLVPARGLLQVGWLTHLFMHAGLGHILGNMLVFFLVVGPFLEDVWGRPFFLAFYLAGGLFAGACQALPMGDSRVPILGASGAISACLGAFTLRFAHRRVRIFYWFLLFVRGTFFVPAWAYALFGAALDIVGLKLSGTAGGVAYAAHVGGFFFGLAVAALVRATRLEDRIAPDGAVRWQGSLGAARAAEALAAGRVVDARSRYQEVLGRDPDDEEALLALARIEAAAMDGRAATAHLDRLLGKRLGAGDAQGARAHLDEFRSWIDPALLRSATAYRAGEALEGSDPQQALRFHEAAASAGGALGAKALLRAAGLLRRTDPARALEHAERVASSDGTPPELAARARDLGAELRPSKPAKPANQAAAAPRAAAAPLGPEEPVRVLLCQLVGAPPEGLDIEVADGRRTRLAPERVEAVAVGVLDLFSQGDEARRNSVVADFVLRGRAGEKRVVVRIPGHAMALGSLRPGVSPRDAFAEIVGGLLEASQAVALPNAAAAVGRPLARFADEASFEEACYRRRITPAASGGADRR